MDPKQKVEALLQERYGIGIADTNEELIDSCLADGETPEEIVERIGEKYDLDDGTGW